MVQVEGTRVMHPFASFTSGVYCRAFLSPHAGKGPSCMLLIDNGEIHFSKIGFLDYKWSTFKAPGPSTLWCHSIWGSVARLPFLRMQERARPRCIRLINKVVINLSNS